MRTSIESIIMSQNTEASLIDYRIFIASSLKMEEARGAVEAAAEQMNRFQAVANSPIRFSCFNFSRSTDIVQWEAAKTAQAEINEKLQDCVFFVLITDGKIGNMSIIEYLRAHQRFIQDKFPAYILVFNLQDAERKDVNIMLEDGGLSYQDFVNKYLKKVTLSSAGEQEEYLQVYSIPYQKPEDITVKLLFNLQRFMDHPRRPFLNACRGRDKSLIARLFPDEDRFRAVNTQIYFSRRFDREIIWRMGDAKMVYIYGESLSGKTRSLLNICQSDVDNWFYLLPCPEDRDQDGKAEVIRQMYKLGAYLGKMTLGQRLYILIDDLDKYDSLAVDGEWDDAFVNLLKKAQNANCTFLFSASVPYDQLFCSPAITRYSNGKADLFEVLIPPMSKSEFREAFSFFEAAGLKINQENELYKTTGALLINLDVKKEEYSAYIQGNVYRECLSKAFKALSIWRDRNRGNIDIIVDLACFLFRRDHPDEMKRIREEQEKNDYDHIYSPEQLGRQAAEVIRRRLEQELEVMANSGRLGGVYFIQKGQRRIRIEEYIYRYFIGFDGRKKSEVNDREEDEWALIRCIMEYCDYQNRLAKRDGVNIPPLPMLANLAKIISRCEHRIEQTRRVQEMWESEQSIAQEDKEWFSQVKEISAEEKSDEVMCHYYSLLFKLAVFDSKNFADALEQFDRTEPSLRDEFLLGALIAKAGSPEDLEVIRRLDTYARFRENPIIILRMSDRSGETAAARMQKLKDITLPSREDYERIFSIFDRGEKPEDGEDFDCWMSGGIAVSMAEGALMRVSSREEYENVLAWIKTNYYLFLKDETALKKWTSFVPLTNLEALCVVSRHTLQVCWQRLFEGELDRMSDYLDREILAGFPIAAEHGILGIETLRAQIATMGASMIQICSDEEFSDVEIMLFSKLETLWEGKKLFFRNVFTYSFMLDTQECDFTRAFGMVRSYLLPHSREIDNPIRVSLLFINKLIKIVRGADQEKYRQVRKIIRLCEELNIRKDFYTYNTLIDVGTYLRGRQLVEEMLRDGISPDVYTFGTLVKCAPDLATALSYLPRLEGVTIPAGFLRNVCSSPEPLAKALDRCRKSLLQTQAVWTEVMKKPCRTQLEQSVLWQVFDWICGNQELSFLLERGILHNALLGNDTMIHDWEEAQAFLEKYPFKKDQITLNTLMKIIQQSGNKDHDQKVSLANDLLIHAWNDGYLHLDDGYTFNLRLDFYHNMSHSCSFVFISQDGRMYNAVCTPLAYLTEMLSCGYPVNRYTLVPFLNSQYKGWTPELVDAFFDLFRRWPKLQQFKYLLLQVLASQAKLLSEDYVQNLIEEFGLKLYVSTYNRYVKNAFSYRNGGRTASRAIIAAALEQLNPADPYSASLGANDILSKYGTGLLFEEVMELYETHFKKPYIPVSETFPILASFAPSAKVILQRIVPEIQRWNEQLPPQQQLHIPASILSELFKRATCVEDFRTYMQYFQSLNQESLPSILAENFLFRLSAFAIKGDTRARNLLDAFYDYILYNREVVDPNACEGFEWIIEALDRRSISNRGLSSMVRFYNLSPRSWRLNVFNIICQHYSSQLFSGDGILQKVLIEKPFLFPFEILNGLCNIRGRGAVREEVVSATLSSLQEWRHYTGVIKRFHSSGITVRQSAFGKDILEFPLFKNEACNNVEASYICRRILRSRETGEPLTHGDLLPVKDEKIPKDDWWCRAYVLK